MKKHLVAVIGGACSGAEATKQLTNAGVEVVVFEQNPMPYGKIRMVYHAGMINYKTKKKKPSMKNYLTQVSTLSRNANWTRFSF